MKIRHNCAIATGRKPYLIRGHSSKTYSSLIGSLMTPAHSRREARIAMLSLVVTIGLYLWLADTLVHKVYDSYFFPNLGPFYGGLIYLAALSIVFYSVIHYHVCLIGNYQRHKIEKVPTMKTV